jgi:hypothetical protein
MNLELARVRLTADHAAAVTLNDSLAVLRLLPPGSHLAALELMLGGAVGAATSPHLAHRDDALAVEAGLAVVDALRVDDGHLEPELPA